MRTEYAHAVVETRTAGSFNMELEPTRLNWNLWVSHQFQSSNFNIGSILQKIVSGYHVYIAHDIPSPEVREGEVLYLGIPNVKQNILCGQAKQSPCVEVSSGKGSSSLAKTTWYKSSNSLLMPKSTL